MPPKSKKSEESICLFENMESQKALFTWMKQLQSGRISPPLRLHLFARGYSIEEGNAVAFEIERYLLNEGVLVNNPPIAPGPTFGDFYEIMSQVMSQVN